MKKFTAFYFLFSLLIFSVIAQNQIENKGFSYQGYARDADGVALANQNITVKFSIMPAGSSTVVFTEEHDLSTDAFGVFHTIVGTVATVDFQVLAFDRFNYQMRIEVKAGTGNFTTLSEAELLAVPYAKAAGNGVPPGTILPFAGETPPSGYLICDGTQVSRTEYPALFAAIGTAWGNGNGSSTFHLPDLRGMFPRGVDTRTSDSQDPDAANRTALNGGGNTGAKVGTYQLDTLKAHNHDINDPGHKHNVRDLGHKHRIFLDDETGGGRIDDSGSDGHGTTETDIGYANIMEDEVTTGITIQNKGGLETRPKNVAVLYIIKI
ncbi:MAG: tail fiber protein [Flammeovirgaceae bacterium]